LRLLPTDESEGAAHVIATVARAIVASGRPDLLGVLGTIGEGLGLEGVYLAFAGRWPETEGGRGPTLPPGTSPPGTSPLGRPSGRPPKSFEGTVLRWLRAGRPATSARWPAESDHAVAVPLLGESDEFLGYLAAEWDPAAPADLASRRGLLPVVGDVLSGLLARLSAEEAGRETEERWRTLVDRHPDPIVVADGGVVAYANEAAARLVALDGPESFVGQPVARFLPRGDADRIAREMEAQAARPSGPLEHEVVAADGTRRSVESVSVPFPGLPRGLQTVWRDVTDRKVSEERYRTLVETISEGVWRVVLDRPVPRGAPLSDKVDHLLRHARLAEVNPSMARMLWGPRRPPVGLPLRRLLGPHAEVVLGAFVRSDHALRAYEFALREGGEVSRHFSVNAVGRFDNDDVVGIWGSCVETTGRVRTERRMIDALEEQQERIGRDLHDGVGQLLTGVLMLSEGVAARTEDAAAARAAAYAAEALDQVRAICRGLVPPQLYSEGAATALAELVAHVDALSPTRCKYHHDGRADVSDPDLGLQIYRVAQEALSNVVRHAGAETAWVHFEEDGDRVVVEVEDDGVGFDPHASRQRSLGLYGMKWRAHSVGGTLSVDSSPGAGTTVRFALPVAGRPGLQRRDTS